MCTRGPLKGVSLSTTLRPVCPCADPGSEQAEAGPGHLTLTICRIKDLMPKKKSPQRNQLLKSAEIHREIGKLWIEPMHIMARLLIIYTQPPSVIERITAILCVASPSEEVIDNRGGCGGQHSVKEKRVRDKGNIRLWKICFHTSKHFRH